MYLLLFLFSIVLCAPALAAPVSSAPELEPGTLAAITSGITAVYFVYRLRRHSKK
ncbi:MAG TPA: hypothetical protein V6C69_04270 [Trichormus sp.]|jgi:hypothetical protein